MDLHDYIRILRRQSLVIVAAALIGLCAGVLNATFTPQTYRAETQLMVSVQVAPNAKTNDLAQANTYARQAIASYPTLIRSSLVLGPVVEDLGLGMSAAGLAGKVQATSAANSLVITVAVTDRNPGQAALIANAVGESFTRTVAEEIESHVGDGFPPIRIATLEPAQVPVKPFAPNLPLSAVLGALLGLAAGIGLAVLRTVLDHRIHSLAEVEEIVEAPTLGGIALDPDAPKRPLVVVSEPQSPRAEAFRSLRTNVRFLVPAGDDDRGAVFVVTSAGPGEGKSTTTANLALAFAETGARVALLDGDLRKPKVADYFGIEGGVGLSDVLAGRIPASEAMQRWGRGALFLLPSGTVPPNPAELLGSAAMKRLLGELRQAFDIVLIDAPPVLLVTDAAVMSRLTDGALMIAAAGRTPRPRLAAAVQAIEGIGARVRGTVVTMLPTAGSDRTAYGTYAYAERG